MKSLPTTRKGAMNQRDVGSHVDNLLKLELRSDPGLLCVVRGAVERLTETFGFSEEECRAVTRAVDEALTNIIRHAYDGDSDRPIELSFHRTHVRDSDNISKEGIEILLSDYGPAIKPEQLCGRKLDDVRPGGLGLHFIQESMDVVEYKRVKDANCLRLVKYLARQKTNQQRQKPKAEGEDRGDFDAAK